jgi:cytochrome b6-f complex iron-sulfur subunit
MAEATATPGQGITRREFLNYIWGAAISLFLAEFGIGVYIFSRPRFREGEFGSDFDLGALSDILPTPDSPPGDFPQAKTWLVNVGPEEAAKGLGKQGLLAIYKVCTHLGCLYKYESTTDRFECPCHGSKYQLDGTRITGPTLRSLDRFVIKLVDESGNVVAETEVAGDIGGVNAGIPLPIPANTAGLRVVVATSRRIMGAGAAEVDQAKQGQGG